ncbi:MAG: glutamine synthetase [Cytophagales bacterium]|jgi:glutamine synthetase|nr:glutamine synthetase [Cytophagales bacterium]MCA6389586.1 glutamine synthetase [Cytophagales bacterium]MCA6393195.1 glutamine synthetase [Cytophagales bacterium]MCA6395873.1 glutamine synthetase [Cytophagales bacterium]MCA6398713.1 glutamine synthetase [Cytophagales bacterium]
MTTQEIFKYVKNHPAGKVKIAYADIDGILRGKYISAEKFLSFTDGATTFCDVAFGWDANDVAYDNGTYTGWHTGYPDAPTRIDFSTFRKIPWESDLPFFLGEIMDAKGNPAFVCPRQLLKMVYADSKREGFTPFFAQEFEWFNFQETPQSAQDKNYKNLTPLTPGMFGYSILRTTLANPFFSDLFDLLKKFGVPIEGLHTETGPGVLEAAIQYAGVIEAADRATLFKTAVKEIAYKHGILATFMAKISESLPGCGGHVHQSLWDKGGKRNLFYDEKDKHHMSEVMKSYVAGQLFCMPHLLPMYAPIINSYKRLVEGAWAPTTLTWGIDNRTVALRVLGSGSKSCRLETRVIGSDVNPYLAMAAALASGLYGIRKKLKLKQPATVGNGYKDFSNGILPSNLHEATKQMRDSTVAKEILGEKFVEHFTQTREWEWRQHLKAVTDWEYKRYFEII